MIWTLWIWRTPWEMSFVKSYNACPHGTCVCWIPRPAVYQDRKRFVLGERLQTEVTYCYLVTGLDSNSIKKSGSSRKSFDCGIQIVAFLSWQKIFAFSNVKNASSEMTIWFPLFRHHAAAVILFVSTANIFNWFLWIEITKLLFIIGYWWIKPSIKYVLLGRNKSYPYDSSDIFKDFQLLADTMNFLPSRFSAHAPSLKSYLTVV